MYISNFLQNHSSAVWPRLTVGIIIERIWIQTWGRSAIVELARPILLKKPDHGRTARASIEPGRKRSSLGRIASLKEPEPHILVCPHGEIARVLIHTLGRLANARVCDKFHLGACRRMLEDGEVLAIALDEGAFVDFGCWCGKGGGGEERKESGEKRSGKHAGQWTIAQYTRKGW